MFRPKVHLPWRGSDVQKPQFLIQSYAAFTDIHSDSKSQGGNLASLHDLMAPCYWTSQKSQRVLSTRWIQLFGYHYPQLQGTRLIVMHSCDSSKTSLPFLKNKKCQLFSNFGPFSCSTSDVLNNMFSCKASF